MRIPSQLPGRIPTTDNVPIDIQGAVQKTVEKPAEALRSDFAEALEARLAGWIGDPSSERGQALSRTVAPFLAEATGQAGHRPTIDLSKLPADSQHEIVRLQKAAEGIEAIFVKQLLAQMRQTSFATAQSGPMASLARDMMDQTVAEQASRSGNGIGIAKVVFLDTAQTLVRSAIGKAMSGQLEK